MSDSQMKDRLSSTPLNYPSDPKGVYSSVAPDDPALFWLFDGESSMPSQSSTSGDGHGGPDYNTTLRPFLLVDSYDAASPHEIEISHSPFSIGGPHSDLPINDDFVSNWHANIFVVNNALLLENVGGYNGTFLRIADELVLEDHDEIVVGNQRLEFRSSYHEGPGELRVSSQGVPRLGAPMENPPARLFRYYEQGDIAAVYPIEDKLVIGQDQADINLADDANLSAPHVCVEKRGQRYYLRDLQSKLGTFIRVREAVELIDGDYFMVGRTRLRIVYQ